MIPKCKENIIETITNESGTAIKFSDGTMIVTQQYIKHIESWSSWQNVCCGVDTNYPPTYPVAFINIPVVTQMLVGNNLNGWLAPRRETGGNEPKLNAQDVQIVRPGTTSTSIADYTINIIAIGRWK